MDMPTIPNIPEAPEVPSMNPAPDVAPNIPNNTGVPEIPGNTNPQNNFNAPQNAGTANNQTRNNQLEIVGRISHPSNQLFEVTGFVDLSKSFPTSNAFLLFVPSQPDNTKASGRTYVQSQRETMKISTIDLFALAEALDFAAKYKACDFMIFTDSSKFAGNQGQGVTKRVSVTAAPSKKDPNKVSVFLSYQGQQKITLVLDPWKAIGLGHQLRTLAELTEKRRIEIERERVANQ